MAFVHGLVNNLRHLLFQQSFMLPYASAHAVTECITLRHQQSHFPLERENVPVTSESWRLEMPSSQPTAMKHLV